MVASGRPLYLLLIVAEKHAPFCRLFVSLFVYLKIQSLSDHPLNFALAQDQEDF